MANINGDLKSSLPSTVRQKDKNSTESLLEEAADEDSQGTNETESPSSKRSTLSYKNNGKMEKSGESDVPADSSSPNSKEETNQSNAADDDSPQHGHPHSASRSVSETSLSEDEVEEEPPLLKYTRINQLPQIFLKKDPLSMAAFGEKVFIFGTHSGFIHLTKPDFTAIRSFKAHKASILSLFCDGKYFASGSMDGTIVIGSVSDARDTVMFDFKRPIHAVVLDKNYQKSRSFVCGGMAGSVIYSSKNWLDQRVDTVLDQDNGPIVAIQTIDDLLLWMNDKGITIYHITMRQVITVISKPSDSFRSDLYWPRVSFPEIDRVLIAWGNYIWSLRTYKKSANSQASEAGSSTRSRILPSAASLSFRTVQEKMVEVEHVFKVGFLISGIASFSDDQWIVLAYNQPEKDVISGQPISQSPDLKILRSSDGLTVHEEELAFNGIENLGLNDYNLFYHIGSSETRYFLLSARDGVIAQQVQLDDRLVWFTDRGMFDRAWEMSQHLVPPLKRLRFGLNHVDILVKGDKWVDATAWLAKTLHLDESTFPNGDTASTLGTKATVTSQAEAKDVFVKEVVSQWNTWSEIFLKTQHVEELTKIIPLDTRWNIKKSIYTDILKYWMEKVNVGDEFYSLLETWDTELYDMKTLTSAMEQKLEADAQNTKLRQQLCDLYVRSHEPDKAVRHLREMKDPHMLRFLDTHHILTSFTADIPAFIKLQFQNENDIDKLPISELEKNLTEATDILVNRRFELLPKTVVNLMSENHLDIVSFYYLEKLAKIDDLLVRGLENKRIELYSQFDRPKLLPFLMSNNNYDIRFAIETCEMNAFVDELVYLLGETGENQKALSLIMEQLEDAERAIKFAKLQNDTETWKALLDFSFGKPNFIKALIELADEQSSKFYNPMTILQNMTTDVHIEGLKESITKVSFDNDISFLLNQLILRVVYKRSEELSKTFNQEKLRGISIDTDKMEAKMIFDTYETVVVFSNSHKEKGPTLELVTDVVHNDKLASKSYTTLGNKLKHLQYIQEKLQQIKAPNSNGNMEN